MGIPVDGLSFDPDIAMRGLVIDAKNGNLLKVDRFGLVKRAMHGNKMLSPSGVQKAYGRDLVHLASSRWIFLNTLFSVSEGCLYMQVLYFSCHAYFMCTHCPQSDSSMMCVADGDKV